MIRLSLHLAFLALALAPSTVGGAPRTYPSVPAGAIKSPLEAKVRSFDVTRGIVRDGVSQLSRANIEGLHLGFEEIIRDKIQDNPWTLGTLFSVHLEDKTVREILDALCQADARYAWSEDGASINIYPRATIGDPSYLLNLRLERIALSNMPDPDQALTPLWKLLPQQQIGYAGPGLGGNAYSEPWSVIFENLTVRQFINRIAEHIGPRSTWVWQGGQGERMFTFLKAGFSTSRPAN